MEKTNGPVYLTSVHCSGMENKITDCQSSQVAADACGDGQHAGVKCIGKIQNYFNQKLRHLFLIRIL